MGTALVTYNPKTFTRITLPEHHSYDEWAKDDFIDAEFQDLSQRDINAKSLIRVDYESKVLSRVSRGSSSRIKYPNYKSLNINNDLKGKKINLYL